MSGFNKRPDPGSGELRLVSGGVTKERADASRNRLKILEAARALLSEQPAADLCMDAVAAKAGVGKGTLYRRFKDRGSLYMALLDEESRKLQNRVLMEFGLPGDTTQVQRLFSFLEALFDFTATHAALLSAARAAQSGCPERYDHPAHTWTRTALVAGLRKAMRTGEIAELEPLTTAELLLAGINPDLIRWFVDNGEELASLKAHFRNVWARVLGC
jgi:AcrR family transcriptional regulator